MIKGERIPVAEFYARYPGFTRTFDQKMHLGELFARLYVEGTAVHIDGFVTIMDHAQLVVEHTAASLIAMAEQEDKALGRRRPRV